MRIGFVAGIAFAAGVLVGLLLAPLLRERPAPQEPPRALTVTPTDFRAGYDTTVRRANALMDEGRYAEAARQYEAALTMQESPEVRSDLGVCYRHLGRMNAALASFRAALARDPQHWEARYNLAVVLLEVGQTGEAARALRELKEQRPDDARLEPLERALSSTTGGASR